MTDRATNEQVLANARLVLAKADAMPRTDVDFRRVAEASVVQVFNELVSYTFNDAINGGFTVHPIVAARLRAAITDLIGDIRTQPITFDPTALPSFVRVCKRVIASKTDDGFQASLRKIVRGAE